MYRNLFGLEMGETILNTLRKYKLDTIENATKYCPIYLHSFDYQTIKYWANATSLPRNYLVTHTTNYNLTDVSLYANGMGVDDSSIWNYTSLEPTPLLKNMKELEMMLHVWTFKDDELCFNSSTNIVSV